MTQSSLTRRHAVAVVAATALVGAAAAFAVVQSPRGADPDGPGAAAAADPVDRPLPPADGPLDPVRLDSMLAEAERIRPLSSLVVWHRGETVLERYYRGMSGDQTTNIKSASKTLLSPLVGIALRDSLIQSVDHP
ncbi:MAG: hypothetical protein ACODAB_09625, partial [Gemmatimonadota bacterium]